MATRCHSLCHSFSFVVTRCPSCHSLPLVVTRCTIRQPFYKRSIVYLEKKKEVTINFSKHKYMSEILRRRSEIFKVFVIPVVVYFISPWLYLQMYFSFACIFLFLVCLSPATDDKIDFTITLFSTSWSSFFLPFLAQQVFISFLQLTIFSFTQFIFKIQMFHIFNKFSVLFLQSNLSITDTCGS